MMKAGVVGRVMMRVTWETTEGERRRSWHKKLYIRSL